MSLSRFGSMLKSWPRVLACAGALSVAAVATGCSSAKQARFHYPGDPHLAGDQVAQAQAHTRKPVVEGDGMEAQPEPLRRQSVEPDDPTEPFSPNYGSRPGDQPSHRTDPPRRSPQPGTGEGRIKAADAAPVPDDLPHYFKSRLVSADTQ